MKTKKSAAPVMEAPPLTVHPQIAEADALFATHQEREARNAHARKLNRCVDAVKSTRDAIAIARKEYPKLVAYCARANLILAKAEGMGVLAVVNSPLEEARGDAQRAQWEQAFTTFDALEAGICAGYDQPKHAAAEILLKVKGADTAVDAKEVKLAAVLQQMRAIDAGPVRTPGPPVQAPMPKGPGRDEQAVAEWNVFDAGGR